MQSRPHTPPLTWLIDLKSLQFHGMLPKARRISLSLIAAIALLIGLFPPLSTVGAAEQLTITPITWNVVGLDSNNVFVGPNMFPVGVRVCNDSSTTTANNVRSAFHWETTDTYINLRPGSLSDYTGANAVTTLAPGACHDFYYEVEVTRNSSAYDHTARYYISAVSNEFAEVSTPRPRELYVEHLISQSRNSTTQVDLWNGSSWQTIPAGGTMSLMVGNTYKIKLFGFTATNGYEQIENYINFPNTIFKVNGVATTYSAKPTPATDPWWASKVYADGCSWVNDPTSLNYRSCTGVGKYGGNVTVEYDVTIIGGAGTTKDLSNLIYDFSGSSYHYNADFAFQTRFASIVDATIEKSFSPKSIVPTAPGNTSTLTFTIRNPGTAALSNLNFTDTLPSNVTIANPNGLVNNCGGSVTATAGTRLISLSNGSLAGASCTISVTVTSSTVGNYLNTSEHLFVGSCDTNSFATDTLVVSSSPLPPSTCSPSTIIAQFNFATNLISTHVSDVSFATITGVPVGTGTFNWDGTFGNPLGSYTGTYWQVNGNATPPTPPNPATYYMIDLDTSNYGGVQLNFQYYMTGGDWAAPGNNYMYVYSDADSTSGPTWTNGQATQPPNKGNWYSLAYTAPTTGVTRTRFFISAAGAKNNPQNSPLSIDNVIITGCPRPDPPVIAKSFGATSILTSASTSLRFNITNPTATTLNGINFTDTLPAGLTVGNTSQSNVCGTGSTLTTTSPQTISLSGGTLLAGASCTMTVTVTGDTAGLKNNSVTVYSTNGGTGNTATASILVRAPSYSLNFIKQVGPTASGPWSNLLLADVNDPVHYRFIVENTGEGNLTNVTATDNTVNIANCTWRDENGVAFPDTDPSGSIYAFTLPQADLLDNGHIAYCVYSSVLAAAGMRENTATVDSNETPTDSDNAYYATTSLTIVKDAVPNDAQNFTYSGSGPAGYNFGGGFSLDDDADGTLPNSRTFTKLVPGSYSLSEGALPSGWTLSSLVCTDPDGGSSVNLGTRTATIDIDPGESITCTYTNSKSGSIVIIEDSIPNDAQDFSYTGTGPSGYNFGGGFSLDDDADPTLPNTRTFADLAVGTYTLSEGALPANWNLTNLVCVDPDSGSSINLGTRTATIDVDAGETITCTYTNTKNGTIVVDKVTVPTGDTQSFNFDAVGGAYADFSLTDAAAPNSQSLAPGAYSVSETVPTGWTLTNSTCVSSIGDTESAASIELDAGETVTCTFTDTKLGTIIIIEDSIPNDAQDFSYSGSGPSGYDFGGGFNLDDDADPTLPNTRTFSNLALGSYTLTEVAMPVGWLFTNLVCVDPDSGTTVDLVTRTATIDIDAGETVTCTYTNTMKGTPVLTTTAATPVTIGTNINDVAHLSGGLGILSGTISFEVFAPSDPTCSIPISVTGGVVNGAGDYTSANYLTTGTGDYRWRAYYSGDANNNPVSTACNDAGETSIVNKASPTISTTPSAGGVIGVTLNDTATLAGGYSPTGSVTFRLYAPSDPTCSGAAVYIDTDAVAPYATSSGYVSDALGTWNWTASYSGDSNNNPSTSGCTLEQVVISGIPSLNVAKSSTTTSVSNAGQVVPYVFSVHNIGNMTLSGITVTDLNCSVVPTYQSGDTNSDSKLQTTETWIYTCSHTVTQAEIDADGDLSNIVTADSVESAPDTDTKNIPISQNPAIHVAKSSTTTSVSNAGQVVPYVFSVHNIGNMTLSGITVTDPKCDAAPVYGSGDGNTDSKLQTTETWVYTCSYTVTQAEIDADGNLSNTVTADSTESGPDTDVHAIPISQNPAIHVAKSSTTTSVSNAGQVVPYVFSVHNIGNMTLSGITVTDPKCDAAPVYGVGDTNTTASWRTRRRGSTPAATQ